MIFISLEMSQLLLLLLVGTDTDVEEIRRDAGRMEEFLQLCQTLRVFVGEDWVLPSATELLQIFGKVCRDTFI